MRWSKQKACTTIASARFEAYETLPAEDADAKAAECFVECWRVELDLKAQEAPKLLTEKRQNAEEESTAAGVSATAHTIAMEQVVRRRNARTTSLRSTEEVQSTRF